MSNGVLELRPGALPARVGQATAVEQSRAVAEVQAAVIVAQQCPRSVPLAVAAMEEACAQIELAARAFFSYPRAGETVNGPSVHLARELARCWGNVQHGITELARDDVRGESEMQAWAWDVQTNTRSSNTFIVPHKRDTKKGVRELTDMRDIYENNANNGARRLREAIFSVLPAWYSARAQALCQATIENGGGRPLAQRIADAVKAFERYRVSPARLAAKFGHAGIDELTASDVAQLGVIYDSLKQGTVTVDDEFEPEQARITPADLAPPKNVPPAVQEPPVSGPAAAPPSAEVAAAGGTRPPQRASTGQVGLIQRQFERLGLGGEDKRGNRVRVVSRLAGRPLASSKELTSGEAAKVKDTLEGLPDGEWTEDSIIAELAMADDPRGDGEHGE
jgi:hypothetical protein